MSRAARRHLGVTILAFAATSGCLGGGQPTPVLLGPPRIQAATFLPPRPIQGVPAQEPEDLVIAPYVVMTSRVARPRAEMRVGPGSNYELLDSFLSQDTVVVILGQLGPWRKVLPIHDGPTAWVHSQALTRAKLNTHSINIRPNRLPMVQVLHDTTKVWLYGKNSLASAQIGRGTMFRTLRMTDHGALVWLTGNQFCGMAVPKGCLMEADALSASSILNSCAPSLSGQLHGHGQVFGPEAKVNITPLATEQTTKGLETLILSVRPDGSFATNEDLPPGDCLVEALVPGFAVASTHINLADGHKKVDLDLKPLPKMSLRTGQITRSVDDGRGGGGATLAPPSL